MNKNQSFWISGKSDQIYAVELLENVASINAVWALTEYLAAMENSRVFLSSVRSQFSHCTKIKVQFINDGNQFKQSKSNSVI